jgi:hypothetical protein
MKFASTLIASLVLIIGVADVASTQAFARGGGSNFMNSPGYQRRLQESRGQVTNQSGSLLSRPYTTPPSTYPGKKWRKRGKR